MQSRDPDKFPVVLTGFAYHIRLIIFAKQVLIRVCIRCKNDLARASDILHGRGAAKFRYIRGILRNSLKILPNTCRYNIFQTYLGYWGCLLSINANLS